MANPMTSHSGGWDEEPSQERTGVLVAPEAVLQEDLEIAWIASIGGFVAVDECCNSPAPFQGPYPKFFGQIQAHLSLSGASWSLLNPLGAFDVDS